MGYRDDEQGLRLRVVELEDQLAEADRKISRLQGQSNVGELAQGTGPTPFKALRLVVEIDGVPTDAGWQAMSRLLEARMPKGGVPDRRDGSLRWQTPALVFSAEPNGRGGTRLSMTENATALRRQLMSSLTVMGVVAGVALPTLARGGAGAVFAALSLLIIALSGPIVATVALRKRRQWAGILEGAAMIASEHAEPGALRIATDALEDAETLADEEAIAAEEMAHRKTSQLR